MKKFVITILSLFLFLPFVSFAEGVQYPDGSVIVDVQHGYAIPVEWQDTHKNFYVSRVFFSAQDGTYIQVTCAAIDSTNEFFLNTSYTAPLTDLTTEIMPPPYSPCDYQTNAVTVVTDASNYELNVVLSPYPDEQLGYLGSQANSYLMAILFFGLMAFICLSIVGFIMNYFKKLS